MDITLQKKKECKNSIVFATSFENGQQFSIYIPNSVLEQVAKESNTTVGSIRQISITIKGGDNA